MAKALEVEKDSKDWKVFSVAGEEIHFVGSDGSTAKLPLGLALAIRDGQALDCEITETPDTEKVVFTHRGETAASIPSDLMVCLRDVLRETAAGATDLHEADEKILRLCVSASGLDVLADEIPRSTVFRHARKLVKAGLLEHEKRGKYRTTRAGAEALEKGAGLSALRESGEEGEKEMRNPYALQTAVEDLRDLKEFCDEVHVDPRGLREFLEKCKKLGEMGLEDDDFVSMLQVAEKTNAPIALIVCAFESKAQMEEVATKGAELRSELNVLQSELKDLQGQIDEASRALKYSDLDPYEIEELSDLKHEMSEACVRPEHVSTFLEVRKELSKHLEEEPWMLTGHLCRLAGFVVRISKERQLELHETVRTLQEILEEGLGAEEVYQAKIELDQALEESRSKQEEVRARSGELQGQIDTLTQERDALLAEKQSLERELEGLRTVTESARETQAGAGEQGQEPSGEQADGTQPKTPRLEGTPPETADGAEPEQSS